MKSRKTKTNTRNPKLIDTDNRVMVDNGKRWGWENGVKRYKLSSINES